MLTITALMQAVPPLPDEASEIPRWLLGLAVLLVLYLWRRSDAARKEIIAGKDASNAQLHQRIEKLESERDAERKESQRLRVELGALRKEAHEREASFLREHNNQLGEHVRNMEEADRSWALQHKDTHSAIAASTRLQREILAKLDKVHRETRRMNGKDSQP